MPPDDSAESTGGRLEARYSITGIEPRGGQALLRYTQDEHVAS